MGADIRRSDPVLPSVDPGLLVRGAGNFATFPAGGFVPVDTPVADLVLAAGVAQVVDVAFIGGVAGFFFFENVGANPLTYSIVRVWDNGAIVSTEKEEPPETDPAATRTLAAAAKGDWMVSNVRCDLLRLTFLSAVGSTLRWYHREE